MSDPSEDKPRVSDAEMLERFQNSKKRPPCSDTLGMHLAEVEQDAKRIRMDFDVPGMFANPTGAVQGGFIAAMMDEAMSTCCIIASNVTMTAPTGNENLIFAAADARRSQRRGPYSEMGAFGRVYGSGVF